MQSTILTLKHYKGLGLAANQVGVDKRFFAIDMSHFDVVKSPLVIINPKIIEASNTMVSGEEGCLSFPGLYQEIERADRVVVTGLDIDGNEVTFEGKGMVARVFQHEIDHLDGTLYIDRMSPFRRSLIKGKLKKIKAGEKD